MDDVIGVLQKIGPCLSGHLAKRLIDEHSLTPSTARKRIHRCQELKRLPVLSFPRNANFVYLDEDYGTSRFWDSLISTLQESTVSYGCALAALIARGGIMPVAHFPIACGSPKAQKKHLAPETVLDHLEQAHLLEKAGYPNLGQYITLSTKHRFPIADISHLKARLLTEAVLLKAIKMWLRNLGIVSYDKVKTREDDPDNPPTVGTFSWDLSAPSYLYPMMDRQTQNRQKLGFIACDVLLDTGEVTARDIQPFINKCKTLRSLRNIGRCLQIFVANAYSREAFKVAKNYGIVPATPETLFGKEVADSFINLIKTLRDAACYTADIDKLEKLFSQLGKIEGAATNLRGALFPYLVAEMLRKTKPGIQQVSQGQLLKVWNNSKEEIAEVDIIAIATNQAVYFIECKGYQPQGMLSREDIQRWLDKIQVMRQYALDHPDWRNLKLCFELWRTGELEDEAKQLIDANSPRKYSIEDYGPSKIFEIASDSRDNTLKKILKEHFFKHPLAES